MTFPFTQKNILLEKKKTMENDASDTVFTSVMSSLMYVWYGKLSPHAKRVSCVFLVNKRLFTKKESRLKVRYCKRQ